MLNIRICYEVDGFVMGSSHRLANMVYDRLGRLDVDLGFTYDLELYKISDKEVIDLSGVDLVIFCDVGDYHIESLYGYDGKVMYVDRYELALDTSLLVYELERVYLGHNPVYEFYLDKYSIVDTVTYDIVEVDINSYEGRFRYKENTHRYVKVESDEDVDEVLKEYVTKKVRRIEKDIESYKKHIIRKEKELKELQDELDKLGGV